MPNLNPLLRPTKLLSSMLYGDELHKLISFTSIYCYQFKNCCHFNFVYCPLILVLWERVSRSTQPNSSIPNKLYRNWIRHFQLHWCLYFIDHHFVKLKETWGVGLIFVCLKQKQTIKQPHLHFNLGGLGAAYPISSLLLSFVITNYEVLHITVNLKKC